MALLGLFTVSASAADATGKWVADVQGPNGNTMHQTFDLKADGSTLTGSVSSPRGDAPITDGKVDGNNISFTVVRNYNGNEFKIMHTGVVSDGLIHFTRWRDGGDDARKMEFDAKPAVK